MTHTKLKINKQKTVCLSKHWYGDFIGLKIIHQNGFL